MMHLGPAFGRSVILLLGVVSGALREFYFVNLNYQLDHLARSTEFSYAHSSFQKAVGWADLRALTAMKWAGALLFILVMFALTLWMARLVFSGRRYHRSILVGFSTIGLLALILHVLSGPVSAFEAVSVKLLHLLQYPVPLLILLAASFLVKMDRSE